MGHEGPDGSGRVSHTVAKQAKKNNGRVAPVLAQPGDPLIMPNGKQVQPVGKKRDRINHDDPKLTANNFKASRQRSFNELPGTAAIVNGCAVVFMYSILGLGDRDIAKAAGITAEQVRQVRTHPVYSECFSLVSDEFINASSGLLASRIAGYSHEALDTVADIARDGRQETNKLRASSDLLAMAGIGNSRGKGGVSGVNNGGEGNELRIVVLHGSDKTVRVELNGEAFGETETMEN